MLKLDLSVKTLSVKRLNARLHHAALRLIGRDRLEYLCSNTMTTVNRRLSPFFWTYALQGLVLRRRQDTAQVTSFEILPNQHWRQPLAGQYVEVTLPGLSESRAYSISAVTGDTFWITVKKQPGGAVSPQLHQQLVPGKRVGLKGPFGTFIYRGQSKVLIIFAGTGITPCYALIQALLALPQAQRPSLQIYGQFSRPEDTLFATDLAQWQARSSQPTQSSADFHCEVAYSQAPEAGLYPPRSAAEVLDRLKPSELNTYHIYLCGPEGFKQNYLEALQARQFPLEQLHVEHFQPVTTAFAPQWKAGTDLPEVIFSPYQTRIQMQPEDRHKTLLELGLAHGLNLEKGCRKGYCGSCKLVLHQGEVQGQTQGKAVYVCQAYAHSARVVLGH